jgi:hypothetical protein
MIRVTRGERAYRLRRADLYSMEKLLAGAVVGAI